MDIKHKRFETQNDTEKIKTKTLNTEGAEKHETQSNTEKRIKATHSNTEKE